MKDIRNILLLVVSLCLVGTWVYHLYDKSKYSNQSAVVPVQDSIALQRSINDSLRLAYNTVLSQIDSSRSTADTSNTATIAPAANEIDSLRNEIAAILTINNITKEDLRRAEEKIKQLQQRLSSVNTNAVSTIATGSVPSPANSSTIKTEAAPKQPEVTNEVFTASGISLRAMQSDKDQITVNAASASSLAITCTLQNRNTSFTDTEVYMVLTDPSGDVVQDDPWQSGMFTTGNDRIPYTRKAKLAYNKGDNSRITMNLKLPEYPKGLYSVQFYHNGVRIGRSTLRLN